MASFKMNGNIPRLKAISVKCGWIDTPEHPGYPPSRKPSGATIAQIARYNTTDRNFAQLFFERFSANPSVRMAIKTDIQKATESNNIKFSELREIMELTLIDCIRDGEWMENTPQWSAFKANHNLNPNPLIASQIMLNSITTEVSKL